MSKRRVASLIGVLGPLCLPCAGESAPQFHTDPVEVWGARFLIAVLVLGISLILITLFRYKGSTPSPLAWALLCGSICVIPLATTGFGTLLVFDRAENVEFCASCHLTMQSYVDDLKDPNSVSLAAVHFKNKYIPDNQCYVCHTSYGMFGTVEAKASAMVDVYKYVTHTYHFPL